MTIKNLKTLPALYIFWGAAVYILVLAKNGLSNDNITHLLILFYFALSLIFYKFRKPRQFSDPKQSRQHFLIWCIFSAAVVEGAYMITNPVLGSLLISAHTPLALMLKNFLTDLAFTLPAYYFIFSVIWRLINKYSYTPWQYAFLMALGQALGDGIRTFLFNPALLLFIPYVMVNYHAMNLLPFLSIHDSLPAKATGVSKWKYISPSIVILTYLACGVVIYTVASLLKLK